MHNKTYKRIKFNKPWVENDQELRVYNVLQLHKKLEEE